jgi:O-acetyl-ADP-ribose deacetylase (regulator of RNase III)
MKVKTTISRSTLEIVQGDITVQDTEAIGNAANSALAGGGGVDGAIHRAGGPSIMAELKAKYKGCPTGSAVITGGGNLKARYVIHAVGPRYSGSAKDAEFLDGAYRKSLELCSQHNISSIAFPSIKLVRFVLFDSKTYQIYESALKELVLPE